ncbi:hypothetical protein KPL76_05590 [Subtercola sp. PAMC28395]|uniref:hypothetical protein n=1 Tax=Subtercola sp. PAMC28395 TaxID=2846775 RepID=UPI001C0CB17D|nr:hypothetical protein [Subtercola sp. PAMC28395]QWT24834.1 hypothetical protein KPL76_05590 [Subtercola sp. PAMC28395]
MARAGTPDARDPVDRMGTPMTSRVLRAALAAAATLATATLLVAGSGTAAQALVQPNGSDGAYYLFDSGTETRSPATKVYAWTDDLVGSPSSRDARLLFSCPADATSVQTFISPVGQERVRSSWSAYADGAFYFGTKYVLESPANLSAQILGMASNVRTKGGNYSLGFACLKSNNVQFASAGVWYTTIHVTAGTGAWTADVPAVTPALISVKPAITGTTTVGSLLTAVPGTWGPGTVKLAYQWYHGDTPIIGATASTYTLAASDQHFAMSVSVTGARPGFEAAAILSDPTTTVLGPFTQTPVPTIAGNAKAGTVLTATAGAWAPAPVSVALQWNRAGVAIPGATAASYTLTGADLGTTITVSATGTATGFITATTTSLPTAAIAQGTLTTATPTITGTLVAGKTLTANAGSWMPGAVALAYQWKRAGVAIAGATASSYVLTAADVTKTISVSVTGSEAGFASATTTSASTTAVLATLIATPVPTIAGAPAVGKTLAATPGTWSPAPVTLTYQWKRSGVAIAGATAATYTLTPADAAKVITVSVTGSKAGYGTVTTTSAATSAILSALTATPVPTIAGTPAVGKVLTATAGTWSPAPVTLAYQWSRAGVVIPGATAATYTPVAADLGKTLTVSVTGSKTAFLAVAKTSIPTSVVAAK